MCGGLVVKLTRRQSRAMTVLGTHGPLELPPGKNSANQPRRFYRSRDGSRNVAREVIDQLVDLGLVEIEGGPEILAARTARVRRSTSSPRCARCGRAEVPKRFDWCGPCKAEQAEASAALRRAREARRRGGGRP